MPERGADPKNVEVEWQLDALDLRPVERWLGTFPRVAAGAEARPPVEVTVESLPVKRTVDVYLDTEDWRIGRSGFVLRIRHHADEGEVTLKDTTPAVAGLRRRLELSEPLPPAGLHALSAEGPVGRRLRALAGDAPLTHLLEIRTRRRPYLLHAGDDLLGEVDLDDTIIVLGDDDYPVRMRRVEVEVDARWVEVLTPLVDQLRRDCALQPAILSKFEVGLLAAGLHVPTTTDLGSTTLPTSPSVGDVAYVVLRRNLGSMLAHEPGTRLGEDIEELHDMRVATRRLRAALELFAGVLPDDARQIRGELGWLAGELGAVRDLDVQRERLGQWRQELPRQQGEALSELADVLERERESARWRLIAGLDSPRYERLVSEFTTLVRSGPDQGPARLMTAAHAPAPAVVPALIRARHRSAAKAARRARRSDLPADFHRLRIRCKRLRYALEFVSEIYDGKTRPFVRQIVALQDHLGVMQDGEVAAERLHFLATTENSQLSPPAVFAMGTVAERYRSEGERLRRSLPGRLTAVKGRRWRRLKTLMENQRRQAGPARPSSGPPSDVGRPAGDVGPNERGAAPASSHGPGPSLAGGASSHEDQDWDDDYAPALRSVPVVPDEIDDIDDIDEPMFLDEPPTHPTPPEPGPPGVRRRKEPVFLPAPPSAARPAPVRPVPRSEPPGGGQDRSFHDRP